MPEGIFTFDEIKRRLQPIFTSHRIRQAILFGSYGKGTATQKKRCGFVGGQRFARTEIHGLCGGVARSFGR